MIAPYSGLGSIPCGFGDVLSDAQTALTKAGYQGVTCRTERVSLPMTDPATGKNYYDQNVCSAPGYEGAFMADVVARGGVDLAAERAFDASQHGTYNPFDPTRDYITDFASGPNTQVLATTQKAPVTAPITVPKVSTPPPSSGTHLLTSVSQGTGNSPAPPSSQGTPATTGTQTPLPSNSPLTASLLPALPQGLNWEYILLGVGGLAVLYFVFGKKG